MNQSFKATKTAVALAVLGLVSSAAWADAATATNVVVNNSDGKVQESTLNFTGKDVAEGSSNGFIVVDSSSATIHTADGTFGKNAAATGTVSIDKNDVITIANGTFSGFVSAKDDQAHQGVIVHVGDNGKAVLDHVTMSNNKATTGRGLVRATNADLTVKNSTFTGNEAVLGGALSFFNSTGTIENTVFSGNSTKTHGGAVYVTGPLTEPTSTSPVNFTGVQFTGNKAAKNGGALAVVDGHATLDNVTFSGNESTLDSATANNSLGGGALYIYSTGDNKASVSAENVVFSGNKAHDNGGALALSGQNASFTLTGGRFEGNTAISGGAVYLWNGATADFTDVDFINNTADDGWAGGIIANTGRVSINAADKDVLISGNTAGTGKHYDGFTAGFMYLQGNSGATFNAEEGRTITIGQTGASKDVDSIASYGSDTKIEKTGAGRLVINSSTQAFAGNFTVREGSAELATGIGEYYFQQGGTGATFTVRSGASATIGQITELDDSNATYTNSGKLTLEKVALKKGSQNIKVTNNQDAELTVGEVTVSGTGGAAAVFTNKGTLYTTLSNLASKDEQGTWTKVNLGTVLNNSDGLIVETGFTGDYTLNDLKKLQLTADTGLGLGDFAFANADLVAKNEDGTTTEESFDNIVQKGPDFVQTKSTVTTAASSDAATVSIADKNGKDITVGAVRVVDTKGVQTSVKTLTVAGVSNKSGSLTIGGGDSQELFLGVTDAVQFTGAVTLGVAGTTNTISQKVEIGNVTTAGTSLNNAAANTVTVANTQTWTNGGTIATDSELTVSETGALTVKNGLNNSGSVTVKGSLDADYLSGTGSILLSGGALGVLGNAPKAATKQTAAAEPFSGALKITNPISMSQSGGNAVGLGVTSAAAVAAAADFFDDAAETMNVYYVGKQIANNKLEIDSTYGVIVDLAGVAATEGFAAEDGVFQGTITANAGSTGKIVFTNLTKDATVLDEETGVRYVQLSAKTSKFEKTTFDLGSKYYATPTVGEDGIVKFAVDQDKVNAQLGGLWMADEFTNYLKDVNIGSNRLIRQLAEEEFDQAAFDEAYKLANNLTDIPTSGDGPNYTAYTEALSRAQAQFYGTLTAQANAVANMAAAGGVYNVMLDAVEQQAKVLNRRTTLANSIVRADAGVTPWVDVFGTWNTADRLYGSSGYEADIYGVSFGADWTASCGAILGAAVTVGTGDANSVDAATKIDNDADFYGFSIYGAHRVGNVNGKFDLGYMHSSNDLSANILAERYSESLDADAFTVGLGAEYLLSAGSFNVVPHAGLRYTNLSVDDLSFGVSNDSMNVFQMPVGVTFSGTFETAGMKVAPMFDLSFVPAFGDKDAVAKFGANEEVTRVVDTTPVQMSLGVNAQLNAWTFGVNYELGVGGDDRLNNAFNLNARYTF